MGLLNSLFSKSFLGNLFPEINWKELDQAGYEDIFRQLSTPGSITSITLDFIKQHHVRLGFLTQRYSGGGWTLLRNITIAPGADLNNRYVLSLIIHEVFHLRQALLTRLSVVGELSAWQVQALGYREAFGKEMGAFGEAFAGTQEKWDELLKLSADSREDLAIAQAVMKEISPKYRSDCLPLFPLFKELWFFTKNNKFKEALSVLINLITCRS